MARERGEAVCDAVSWWARRRRTAKRRDERPEWPGRSETEEPAELKEDRYWRAEHTRGKRPCPNVCQQRRVPDNVVGNWRELAAR
jgi:hypothetical protein